MCPCDSPERQAQVGITHRLQQLSHQGSQRRRAQANLAAKDLHGCTGGATRVSSSSSNQPAHLERDAQQRALRAQAPQKRQASEQASTRGPTSSGTLYAPTQHPLHSQLPSGPVETPGWPPAQRPARPPAAPLQAGTAHNMHSPVQFAACGTLADQAWLAAQQKASHVCSASLATKHPPQHLRRARLPTSPARRAAALTQQQRPQPPCALQGAEAPADQASGLSVEARRCCETGRQQSQTGKQGKHPAQRPQHTQDATATPKRQPTPALQPSAKTHWHLSGPRRQLLIRHQLLLSFLGSRLALLGRPLALRAGSRRAALLPALVASRGAVLPGGLAAAGTGRAAAGGQLGQLQCLGVGVLLQQIPHCWEEGGRGCGKGQARWQPVVPQP